MRQHCRDIKRIPPVSVPFLNDCNAVDFVSLGVAELWIRAQEGRPHEVCNRDSGFATTQSCDCVKNFLDLSLSILGYIYFNVACGVLPIGARDP